MRDYGKVHTSFWTSANVRALSEDGRALAMYLLTCPHGTIAGVFRIPDGYACEDLQWSSERVQQGFDELLANGFANRCETSKWVWIVKHFDWNPPENPNQRKSAAKIAGQIPDECEWKQEYMRVCGRFIGIDEPAKTNPSGTVKEPFLNQEQEQEQYKNIGAHSEVDAPPSAPPSQKSSQRGSRLPEDWKLPKSWGDWAIEKFPSLTTEYVRGMAEQFRDHWHAKAGKDAAKADWEATWRNWVRRDREFSPAKPIQPPAGSLFRGAL